MEKVTGIGGVFFKAQDPGKLAAWYREHLGVPAKDEMAQFFWRDKEQPEKTGQTVWSIFAADSDYFGSPSQVCMLNYRVANLDAMVKQLRDAGVTVHKVVDDDYGRFAWVTDPEGNRVELWEPKGE